MNFVCAKDHDVEDFLHNRALNWDELAKCKVYLIFDDEYNLLAYFAVAISVITFDDSINGAVRKALDGTSHKTPSIPVFLIGQLGKNDKFKDKITGREVLEFAISVIAKAHDAVAGRIVRVDCSDTEKVLNFYKDNGFKFLQKLPAYKLGKLNMLVRSII